MKNSDVYRYPHYYAIGYRWNTEVECDFIESCLKVYGSAPAKRPLDSDTGSDQADLARGRPERAKRVEGRLLDIGCGTGRHLFELARRGYHMTGLDPTPEMVAYVKAQRDKTGPSVNVAAGDLRKLGVTGPFDAAYCLMDTFRFLLTNEDIVQHLQDVAAHLNPGGLYVTDFWVPTQWDQIGNEIHQWEQTEGDTTVRVFYLQHPDTVDPITQTFEDELVFEVREGDRVTEIRGGPTRTRLIMPQEFHALVEASGAFTLLASHGSFDPATPFTRESLSWRMVSVLKKR